MIEKLIESTAWEMTPPKPYGLFHILFMLVGFAVCISAAYLCRNFREKGHKRLLLCLGTVLLVGELYKQLFYCYHIGGGSYQWWVFPFQLCSVPMYLCVAAAVTRCRRISDGLCRFMSTYNFLGGFIAFVEPSGLCHEYWSLTIHAFVWHMLLVFIGVYLILSGRGCKNLSDFRSATYTFLILCAAAFCINLAFGRASGGTINMFFVGPAESTLIVFKDIAHRFGWYASTALFIPCVCFGAWLVYLCFRRLGKKRTAA